MVKLLLFTLILTFTGCSFVPYKGDIKYLPTNNEKKVPTNQSACVKTFSNNTENSQTGKNRSTTYGTLRGGFGDRLKEMETQKEIGEDVAKAVENFLSEKGVDVNDPSCNLTIKGRVNDMWVQYRGWGGYSLDIDIDLKVVNKTTENIIWNGKAERHQTGNFCDHYPDICEKESVKCYGYDCHCRGLEIYTNRVFSEELRQLWNQGGMKDLFKE